VRRLFRELYLLIEAAIRLTPHSAAEREMSPSAFAFHRVGRAMTQVIRSSRAATTESFAARHSRARSAAWLGGAGAAAASLWWLCEKKENLAGCDARCVYGSRPQTFHLLPS
jgi:hypothetical protein